MTLSPPVSDVEPTIRVPAVMAERSVDVTLNVSPPAPTEIDLLPFGSRATLPDPAFTLPENPMSCAVIVMAEFVEDMEVETALVTEPLPFVEILTPVVPVALALIAMELPIAPLLAVVDKTRALPETAFDIVKLALELRVNVPLVEVMAPDVPRSNSKLGAVMVKVLPTEELPTVKLDVKELVINAVPGLPVFAVTVEALISIGVPTLPISPVPEDRLTVLLFTVKAPPKVMSPVPLACRFVVVAPPPVLALMVMLPLLVVASVTVPPDVAVTLPLALIEAPVMEIVVLPPVTVPVDIAPRDVAVSVLVPNVIVCPVPV